MTAPAAFDAASVIIAKNTAGSGFQILLIARHPASRFAAGQYAFPGGRIEPEDGAPGVELHCRGLTNKSAATMLALQESSQPLRFWVAAIREVFEEVGLLYACGTDGRLVGPERDQSVERQGAVKGESGSFLKMIQAHGLQLALDRLHYFAYWITPEERPLRFTTRFFVAPAPPEQDVLLDTRESTDFRWLSPGEALAENRRGNLPLHFPTIKLLEELSRFADSDALLASTKSKAIQPIMPRLVVEGGTERLLLPTDPNY